MLVEQIREQAAGGPLNRMEYHEAIDAVYREHTIDAMGHSSPAQHRSTDRLAILAQQSMGTVRRRL